jgi:hypothetical protein
MARLRRFESNRFVGTRDTMIVYDCDDPDQFTMLEARMEAGDLVDERRLQAFGPDTLAEAGNRGFGPP